MAKIFLSHLHVKSQGIQQMWEGLSAKNLIIAYFYFRLSTSVDCKISFHNVQFVNVVNNKQVYILKTLFCVFFHFIYLNTSLFDTGTIKGFLFPHYLLPSYSGKGCLYSFLKNQAISIVSPKSVQQFSLETLTDSKVIHSMAKYWAPVT